MASVYLICTDPGDLPEGTMLTQPHPTVFHEESEVRGRGDGQADGLGYPWAEWSFENQILSAEEWDELISFVGELPSAAVYVRTRTNQITGGEYQYTDFSGIMHRPEGRSYHGYRYRDVRIKFTRLVAV